MAAVKGRPTAASGGRAAGMAAAARRGCRAMHAGPLARRRPVATAPAHFLCYLVFSSLFFFLSFFLLLYSYINSYIYVISDVLLLLRAGRCTMFGLAKKKAANAAAAAKTGGTASGAQRRAERDHNDMKLPPGCAIHFDNPGRVRGEGGGREGGGGGGRGGGGGGLGEKEQNEEAEEEEEEQQKVERTTVIVTDNLTWLSFFSPPLRSLCLLPAGLTCFLFFSVLFFSFSF